MSQATEKLFDVVKAFSDFQDIYLDAVKAVYGEERGSSIFTDTDIPLLTAIEKQIYEHLRQSVSEQLSFGNTGDRAIII